MFDMEVTEQDLHNLYSWIDDLSLSRPKRNFTRDFSDGVLMAEVLHHYFPKMVALHNYSAAHGRKQKLYTWETLNRKVLERLDIHVPEDHLEAIVDCEPRAVERLLKAVRVQILRRQTMKPGLIPRATTPESSFRAGDEDANNRLAVESNGKGQTTTNGTSQIPRAPSRTSLTPPPAAHRTRPKSSFDMWSSNEKDLLIKELQETNELLLAKISKLEQLLNLKDRKIESLVSRLQHNNAYSSSPSP